MNRNYRWAALAAVGFAALALADRPLYVKSKDTRLLSKPSLTASVLTTLQPGTELTWKGADPKERSLHRVVVAGKEGYVLQANLTPNKPSQEVLVSDGQPISGRAIASSGAATKALTPAALAYAKAKGPSAEEAAAEIIYLEELNKNKGTPELIHSHLAAAGLPGGAK